MRLREHPAVQGNGNVNAFRIDWRQLKPDPLNDLRDLTTPENRAHIESLKAQIKESGVKRPFEIRYDGTDILVTDGKCRLTALRELQAEGWDEVKTVLTLPEQQGLDDAERTLGILVGSVSSKNLDPIEIGNGIRRLVGFGWSHEQIAQRMGWKSAASVDHHLEFAALPAPVKEAVQGGTVSATAARKLVEKHGDAAPQILKQATETAKSRVAEGEAVKVKPRDIEAVAPKPKPAPHQVEPEVEKRAETVSVPNDEPGTPAPRRISVPLSDVMHALQPIMEAAERIDLSAVDDGDKVSIPAVTARDVKTVLAVWRALHGDDAP